MRPAYLTALLAATAIISLSLGSGAAAQGAAPASPPAQQTTTQAGPAEAEAAQKPIRGFYDALLASMKQAKQLGVMGRYKRLEPAVARAFDFGTMTKFILGEDWAKLTEAQQKQLVDAFGRLTTADYARNFDDYGGESFTISPKVQLRGDSAIVSTQMVVPGKQAIPFLYRMQKTAAGWRIVDIYLNGYISEVAQRRADFQSTLKSGGADALIKKLNQMVDETLKS